MDTNFTLKVGIVRKFGDMERQELSQRSSAEVEYRFMAQVICELMRIRTIFNDLKIQ